MFIKTLGKKRAISPEDNIAAAFLQSVYNKYGMTGYKIFGIAMITLGSAMTAGSIKVIMIFL